MASSTEAELTERGTYTLREAGDYLIEVIPMAFNDRLVLTPKAFLDVYDFGWCYDKGGAAYLAALVWRPDDEDEPPGWKKRIGIPRRCPNRDDHQPHRCDHGQWSDCDFHGCKYWKGN